MFRKLESSLPPDPHFEPDLKALGYYINEHDQIRAIKNPKQEFHYAISKNERVLEMQREAMDECVRRIVKSRMIELGFQTVPLPPVMTHHQPHIDILCSSNIASASRIVVYIGDRSQDLGIFAYRLLHQDSIASGSICAFAAALQNFDDPYANDTALIIANPGQLVWYRKGSRSMTLRSWDALPRKTGVSPGLRMDSIRNRVPGHESEYAHIEVVLEYISVETMPRSDISFIALADEARDLVTILDKSWHQSWHPRVSSICVGVEYPWDFREVSNNAAFQQFWSERARAYVIHDEPLDTPIRGHPLMRCNCYSSGESQYTECIMPRAYPSMLRYIHMAFADRGYKEPCISEGVDSGHDPRRLVSWVGGDNYGELGPTFSMADA